MADVLPGNGPPLPERRSGPYVARRDIRVSDAERQAVVDELRTHFGAGRLEFAEFEERTRVALTSRVRGDLQPLLDDLPDLGPEPAAGPPMRAKPGKARPVLGSAAFRVHLYITLVISAFLIVVYAGAGGGDVFWPIFPIAALGLPVGIHAAVRKGTSPPPAPPAR